MLVTPSTIPQSDHMAARMPFRYQSKWSLRYAPTTLENPAAKAGTACLG